MAKNDNKNILGIFLGILAIYLLWLSFSSFQETKVIDIVVASFSIIGFVLFALAYKIVSD